MKKLTFVMVLAMVLLVGVAAIGPNTAIFKARAPGTATVALCRFSGAGSRWERVGEVRVTVTAGLGKPAVACS